MRSKKMRILMRPIMFVFSILLSGCGGGGSSSGQGPIVTKAPFKAVVNLKGISGNSGISLTWDSPEHDEFQGVLIRRGIRKFPENPLAPASDDDKNLYDGNAAFFEDTDSSFSSKHYYSVFGYDKKGNYTDAAIISVENNHPKFTIVVLPDTQIYSEYYPAIFSSQTKWIVENKIDRNIIFVLHTGDLVNKNVDEQWSVAQSSMNILDGVVPYAISPGNHDVEMTELPRVRGDMSVTTAPYIIATGNESNESIAYFRSQLAKSYIFKDSLKFNSYFPFSKFKDSPFFGGVYGDGKMDNTYYYFSAGGTDWLVVAVRYYPDNAILDWAGQVVAANPHRRVIFLTHHYLESSGSLGYGGLLIWNRLVKKHPNMLLVFNGHDYKGGSSTLISSGDMGNRVYQMHADYEGLNYGGLGYLRLIEFDPRKKRISVKTYSPWLKSYKVNPEDQFDFENVDFSAL